VDRFDKKPTHPQPMTGDPDFGRDLLPGMVRRGCTVMAFPFRDRNSGTVTSWRGLGARVVQAGRRGHLGTEQVPCGRREGCACRGRAVVWH
jgi:hypothetical protein